MSKATTHITADDLLRLADGELSAPETVQAKEHLAACWQCRAQLEEMEQAIAVSVRYRDSLYQRCFPSPSAPWCDLQQRMAALDAASGSASFFGSAVLRKMREKLGALGRGLVVSPQRWAPALAALLAVAIIVDQFQNAPSVRAAALLEKATVAADSRVSKARRIQLRTRTQRISRIVGEKTQDSPAVLEPVDSRSLTELEGLFRAANYDWNDPLSARAFQNWRAGLAAKTDEVVKVSDPQSPEGDCFEVRTSTETGVLQRASLRLRVGDLRPVESKLSFREFGPVEILELSDVPPPSSGRSGVETRMVSPGLPSSSEKGEESTEAAVAPATPADELRVYAALHNLGADLGEPVEVRRSGDRVLVEGVGIAPDVQEKLERELAALPKVQVDFSRTPATGSQPSENETRSTAILTPHPLVVNWQESMAKQLGGRTGLDKFSEQMLDRVDKLTARAHALRNLALRFPDASVLSEADRVTLRQIRADHTRALTAEVAQIRQAMGPVAAALQVQVPTAEHGFAAWPAGAHVVFQLVRDVESRMAILFGGATGNVTADLPERLFQGLDELGDRAPGLERE